MKLCWFSEFPSDCIHFKQFCSFDTITAVCDCRKAKKTGKCVHARSTPLIVSPILFWLACGTGVLWCSVITLKSLIQLLGRFPVNKCWPVLVLHELLFTLHQPRLLQWGRTKCVPCPTVAGRFDALITTYAISIRHLLRRSDAVIWWKLAGLLTLDIRTITTTILTTIIITIYSHVFNYYNYPFYVPCILTTTIIPLYTHVF